MQCSGIQVSCLPAKSSRLRSASSLGVVVDARYHLVLFCSNRSEDLELQYGLQVCRGIRVEMQVKLSFVMPKNHGQALFLHRSLPVQVLHRARKVLDSAQIEP